jgi:sec-independent protein translocase protein TatA
MQSLLVLSFFSISPGGGELILVLLVVLLLFGAKNVPKIARSMGKAMEEFRRAAREVHDEIMHSDTESTSYQEPKLLPDEQAFNREYEYPDKSVYDYENDEEESPESSEPSTEPSIEPPTETEKVEEPAEPGQPDTPEEEKREDRNPAQ